MKQNLVVFDFCETIANFQTADAFVEFVLTKKPKSWRNFYYEKIISFLKKNYIIAICYKFFPKKNIEKRLRLFALRGIKQKELLELGLNFHHEVVSKNYNQQIISLLRTHKYDNDIIVVSSGGYDTYLKYFCKSEDIKYLNCTKIRFRNNKCKGFFEGSDCMFEEKLNQINLLINKHKFTFEKKIVYSDSITDMPLYKWADEAFIVSAIEQDWAFKNKFNQIIINK